MERMAELVAEGASCREAACEAGVSPERALNLIDDQVFWGRVVELRRRGARVQLRVQESAKAP